MRLKSIVSFSVCFFFTMAINAFAENNYGKSVKLNCPITGGSGQEQVVDGVSYVFTGDAPEYYKLCSIHVPDCDQVDFAAEFTPDGSLTCYYGNPMGDSTFWKVRSLKSQALQLKSGTPFRLFNSKLNPNNVHLNFYPAN